MKTKIILFFLLFSKVLFAQEANDKIFYSDSLHQIATADDYYTKIIVKDYFLDKPEYKYLEYYKSGNLKSEKTISGKDGGQPKEEGIFDSEKFGTDYFYKVSHFWDENGTQTVINGNGNCNTSDEFYTENGSYKNGYKEGDWNGESSKRGIIFDEKYVNGKFIVGETTKNDGTKKTYTVLEKRPEPKKGIQHFYKYIGSKFRYTKESIQNQVQGRIVLQFVVDKEGKIVEPKIMKSLGYGLDEEAIRVLTSYDEWNPGEQKGVFVKCLYSLPLSLTAQ
jgi:TonB family protein